MGEEKAELLLPDPKITSGGYILRPTEWTKYEFGYTSCFITFELPDGKKRFFFSKIFGGGHYFINEIVGFDYFVKSPNNHTVRTVESGKMSMAKKKEWVVAYLWKKLEKENPSVQIFLLEPEGSATYSSLDYSAIPDDIRSIQGKR